MTNMVRRRPSTFFLGEVADAAVAIHRRLGLGVTVPYTIEAVATRPAVVVGEPRPLPALPVGPSTTPVALAETGPPDETAVTVPVAPRLATAKDTVGVTPRVTRRPDTLGGHVPVVDAKAVGAVLVVLKVLVVA